MRYTLCADAGASPAWRGALHAHRRLPVPPAGCGAKRLLFASVGTTRPRTRAGRGKGPLPWDRRRRPSQTAWHAAAAAPCSLAADGFSSRGSQTVSRPAGGEGGTHAVSDAGRQTISPKLRTYTYINAYMLAADDRWGGVATKTRPLQGTPGLPFLRFGQLQTILPPQEFSAAGFRCLRHEAQQQGSDGSPHRVPSAPQCVWSTAPKGRSADEDIRPKKALYLNRFEGLVKVDSGLCL